MKEKRLITVALPYTNNIPHLGNIVGSHLPGDIFVRYCRLMGHDAILIGGTDEHGTPITVEAQKYGITPKQLSDKFYKIHKEIYDWLNISYDNFSRTSKPIHHKTTQEFFLKMYKNGYLTEKKIQVPFCESCNQSLPDRFIEGTCPNCGYEKARGDQCENCSDLLEPIELKEPRCAICDSNKIKFLEKKHLFFRLDELSKKLESWIKKNKTWRKNVKNIALSWIKEGLKPRDITRDMDWGVKIPIKGYEGSVVYVWGEAAIGYISSTKEWDKNKWKDYWKSKKSKIYQFIGKDNIPFHTLLFPAELLSIKDNYNLPYNVVGLQYLNYERGKFSKSQRRGVFCENLKDSGLGPDYWRFYLTFVIPETKDSEFLWKDFEERINSDLIGNFCNFINRNLSFSYQNFDGKIPSAVVKDKTIQKKIVTQIDRVIDLFEKVELRLALEEILKLSDLGNKYFQNKEPWKTKDKEVLFICGNLSKILALLIQPYLPDTSKRILEMLNCKEKDWKEVKKFNLKNHKIKKPEILFKRLEEEQIKDIKEKTSQVSDVFSKKVEPLKEEVVNQEIEAFSISPKLKNKGMNVEVALFKDVKVSNENKELKKEIKETLENIKNKKNIKDDIFEGYKEFYKKIGEDHLMPASQNLLDLIKKNGKLPNINTVVNAYNIISADTLLAVGAHDVSKIKGDIRFDLTEGSEIFIPLGENKPIKIKEGEYAFRDDEEILCRLDVKQCDKTKITKDTKDFVVYVQGNKYVKDKAVKVALERICKLIKKTSGGEYKILTENKLVEPPSGQVKLEDKISFEDFDFRVGEVKGVKDHPNADKLYILKIDLGKLHADNVQIVSGLKDWYDKKDLIGKKIIILNNLKEAVIRGIESQGMLLAAGDGKDLGLLTVKKSRNGARVFIDLREKSKEQVEIEDFLGLKLVTRDGKVIYNKKVLRTEKEEVKLDKKIKDGVGIE
tara:strand:+ start:39861 stop:42719 length:2859 start_codon:yes stop_codon:yes gene_type:complete